MRAWRQDGVKGLREIGSAFQASRTGSSFTAATAAFMVSMVVVMLVIMVVAQYMRSFIAQWQERVAFCTGVTATGRLAYEENHKRKYQTKTDG
jgi:hypothetical protein